MRALTICQPYAELIARGEKVIENRSKPTKYRGELVIHAGKSRTWLDHDDLTEYPDMAFGAIVATARLIDCVAVADLPAHLIDNEHANGPWCYLLADVKRIAVPVPMTGMLGLFHLKECEIAALAAARLVPCVAD